MPTVRLEGHQHTYPVSDILRLFFGQPAVAADGTSLQAGEPEPVICSCLRPAGTGQAEISTGLAGKRITAVVPAGLARREIKRQLYRYLSDWTNLRFPWGSLTGIRPTLVARECLDHCASEMDACRELTDYWHVSPAKADLALETAAAEQALIRQIPPGSAMAYLGVPFCPSRCAYCSFITQDAWRQADRLGSYVEAVLNETAGFFQNLSRPLPIMALYIGGGTPTSLPDPLFAQLLTGIRTLLPLLPGAELTVEAGRPDTITPSKLAVIQSIGTTRLCINPQTFHDDTLVRIGRCHTAAQTREAFRLARRSGFGRINMDLIAGLPGETAADFADSLRQALDLQPESITLHTLSVKRSSRLKQQKRAEGQGGRPESLPDPELAAMLEQSGRSLRSAGLFPYYLYRQKDMLGGLENTGFAVPGCACLYNIGMMGDACSVIGLGSGSMSKLVAGGRVERLPDPRDIGEYIGRVGEITQRKLELFSRG